MHGREWKAAAFGFLSLSALAGCNGQLSPQAEALLADGAAAYKDGRYDVTVRQMDAFLRDNGGSNRADEGYYLRGMAKLRLKDVDGAKADLNAAAGRTKRGEVKGKALVELGELAFEAGDAAAEGMFATALDNLPQDKPPADIAHYRVGCLLQRQGKWTDADAHFSKVLFLFPGGQQARLASNVIRCRAWTAQVGSFEDLRKAEATAGELRRSGLAAAVESVTRDGKLLHRVQVGRHSTYDQAVAAMPEVRKRVADAIVVPTR